MRFEHIVLLVIAFNVVSAVLQRRARKRREAEGIEDMVPEGEERAGTAAEPSPARRRRDRAHRGAVAREPAPAPGVEGAEEPVRMPSLGRDILDQLARDLGLKIPSPAPQPAPRPAPRPAQVSKPVSQQSARPATSLSSPEPARKPRPVVQVAAPVPPVSVNVGRLDAARLREAFVLKEILDPPVARRAGARGLRRA